MRWFFPSWSGDFRLEPADEGYRKAANGAERCVLVVERPSPAEVEALAKFFKKTSAGSAPADWADLLTKASEDAQRIPISMPLGEAGQLLVKVLKPKNQTVTAVKFTGGQLEVAENTELPALVAKAGAEGAEAAASVARPTPSCPQCMPGAIAPASEVLLTFLSPQQHRDWAQHRAIVVTGQLTGCRYIIAHRRSHLAARFGRITYDLDTGCVVHFHDQSVPPEEEVLAAKLILEHREPWLRNEATMLGVQHVAPHVFKNPFGGWNDGIADAALTKMIGLLGSPQ